MKEDTLNRMAAERCDFRQLCEEMVRLQNAIHHAADSKKAARQRKRYEVFLAERNRRFGDGMSGAAAWYGQGRYSGD